MLGGGAAVGRRCGVVLAVVVESVGVGREPGASGNVGSEARGGTGCDNSLGEGGLRDRKSAQTHTIPLWFFKQTEEICLLS